jgi:CheY-like chemotaxis protein
MGVGKKVLIIEDEEMLADNIMAFLQRSDCEVRVAGDARRAMDILDDFAPEVVVLDYHLPGLNGFQTLDAIRQRMSCDCVLITGHPSDEIHAGVRQRGIRDVLFKPFPLHELVAALNRGGLPAPPSASPAGAPETVCPSAPNEQAVVERRSRRTDFSLPFRLPTGGWLFVDRRRGERRS